MNTSIIKLKPFTTITTDHQNYNCPPVRKRVLYILLLKISGKSEGQFCFIINQFVRVHCFGRLKTRMNASTRGSGSKGCIVHKIYAINYSTRETTGLKDVIVSSIAMQLQFLQLVIL